MMVSLVGNMETNTDFFSFSFVMVQRPVCQMQRTRNACEDMASCSATPTEDVFGPASL